MNRNRAWYVGLFAALMGYGALAQTPPPKRIGKPVVVRPRVAERPNPSVETQPCHIWEIEYDKFLETPDPERGTPGKPRDPNQVLTYAERMPTLNGGNAVIGSLAVINRYLVVPPNAAAGRVYVRLVVDKAGRVRQPKIIRGLRADVDSAVVAATRRLPRFTPGQHGGHAVNMSFVVPVVIMVTKQP